MLELKGHEAAIEELLEEMYGHEKIKERYGEPIMSKDNFIKGLKKDGFL